MREQQSALAAHVVCAEVLVETPSGVKVAVLAAVGPDNSLNGVGRSEIDSIKPR